MFPRSHVVLFSMFALAAASVRAVPTLQLDIVDGVYNSSDATTVATSSSFTLRALLHPGNGDGLVGTTGYYHISAAIEPLLQQTNPPPNIGTFTIDGLSISPATMQWGTPPVDVADSSSHNLASHGAFPTYYAELSFNFDALDTIGAYNAADGSTCPGSLYYHDFLVDITNLDPGYSVHFDLYDEKVKSGVYCVDDFAPFSHDAQSGTNVAHVPDSGSGLLMLGAALAGLGFVRRRRRA
jgi:hypothetical protein